METLNGLYTITNMKTQTRLDLSGEKSSLTICTIGTKVVGWAPHKPTSKSYGYQVWKFQRTRGEGLFTCYTIANVKSGTYLEAVGSMDTEPGVPNRHDEGFGKDGIQLTCSKANKVEPSSQEWQLFKDPMPKYPGVYAIFHVASNLLIDMEGGSPTNGTKIQIHCGTHDIGEQTETFWLIEPAEYSQSGAQTTVDTNSMPASAEASQKDA
ncbi:hypothetical protein R3P38DRAFT_3616729 [Favolaschia claudopus]|uniref:Ricin B lectin domain-containing protein n=1 Tax=Favolaschia claudopus TaxID=2862362 RepID=A0AAW0A3P9_9AGAR